MLGESSAECGQGNIYLGASQSCTRANVATAHSRQPRQSVEWANWWTQLQQSQHIYYLTQKVKVLSASCFVWVADKWLMVMLGMQHWCNMCTEQMIDPLRVKTFLQSGKQEILNKECELGKNLTMLECFLWVRVVERMQIFWMFRERLDGWRHGEGILNCDLSRYCTFIRCSNLHLWTKSPTIYIAWNYNIIP